MKRQFDTFFIDDDSLEDLTDQILWSLKKDTCPNGWHVLNPHSYVTAKSDPHFSEALKTAKWLIPDGIGVIIFSKVFGIALKKRITGWDIFHSLSKKMNDSKGKTVFFLVQRTLR